MWRGEQTHVLSGTEDLVLASGPIVASLEPNPCTEQTAMLNRPILKLPVKTLPHQSANPGMVEAHLPASASATRVKRPARYPLVQSRFANRRT